MFRYTSLKSILHNKNQTQIHSIVLAYIMFIDKVANTSMARSNVYFVFFKYTGHWSAELVEGLHPHYEIEMDTKIVR